jgi:hypothetical protein
VSAAQRYSLPGAERYAFRRAVAGFPLASVVISGFVTTGELAIIFLIGLSGDGGLDRRDNSQASFASPSQASDTCS